MKLKVLFLLNCESSKYIAKFFSLSILSCCMIAHIFNDKNEVAGGHKFSEFACFFWNDPQNQILYMHSNSRLRLLPVIFCKIVTKLCILIDVRI